METRRSALQELRARGMIDQLSNEEALRQVLGSPGSVIYVGFDPTADSLHVGHLLPAIVLHILQEYGHKPIVLVGGATGMIGDPSGRVSERQLLTPAMVAKNAEAMGYQLRRFVCFEGSNAAVALDNGDWIRPMSHIDWLREVGKYFTINYMLAKESVRRRLEDREQGISYTEFSYMLLQAFDFLYLFDNYGCAIQAGGSDQWGNITAGIDLVRKVRGQEVYGITLPLLSTASGEKFGKSAGNAIWLDPKRTTPYQFYQFWFRTDDRDVERYLKLFTFESVEAIEEICAYHAKNPERREAQKLLAARVTEVVHGEEALRQALRASEVLFGSEINGLSDVDLADIFADVPSVSVGRDALRTGFGVVDAMIAAGACKSKGEAQRLLQSGGVYLNNRRVVTDSILSEEDLASETMLVLRTGKRNYRLIRFA